MFSATVGKTPGSETAGAPGWVKVIFFSVIESFQKDCDPTQSKSSKAHAVKGSYKKKQSSQVLEFIESDPH